MKKFKIIHHVDQEAIDRMFHEYEPVFILSTGRSGSKFVVELLNQSDSVSAFHEPPPALMYFSNFAYHNQEKRETLSKIIETARMEFIMESFIKNKIYMESNQCLTFFAPVLDGLFKNSKFIHLIRHPGDFARSAIRKGWHRNDSIWESGRVRKNNLNEWNRMGQIEKISWVWQTTNSYIADFGNQVEPQRFLTIQLEHLTSEMEAFSHLAEFAGAGKIPRIQIKKMLKKKNNPFRLSGYEPPNIKKTKDYPQYREWKEADREILKKECQPLAEKFGYQL